MLRGDFGHGIPLRVGQTDGVDEQTEPTLSVTQLNTVIRDALRAAVPETVWVRGEVQA